MTKGALDERDPWLLIRKYYCEFPTPSARKRNEPNRRYRISAVTRSVRHAALRTIFEILGAKSLRQRLIATRIVVDAISDYHKDWLWLQSRKVRHRWFKGIVRHAEALAELAEMFPDEFAFLVMESLNAPLDAHRAIRELKEWAQHAGHYGGLKRLSRPMPANFESFEQNIAYAKRQWFAEAMYEERQWAVRPKAEGMRAQRPKDSRPEGVVRELRPLYFLATGRNPKRRDPMSEEYDPSVHFLHAVWTLAGVPRAHATIDDDVRDCRSFHRKEWDDEELNDFAELLA